VAGRPQIRGKRDTEQQPDGEDETTSTTFKEKVLSSGFRGKVRQQPPLWRADAPAPTAVEKASEDLAEALLPLLLPLLLLCAPLG
jgi:hypothetical protein